MIDRASELRAIADGRLMLNVRNGVTVSRSMLAMIADEIDALRAAPLTPAEVGGHADAQTEARAIARRLWKEHGGEQHGPHTETLTMPLDRFGSFIDALITTALAAKDAEMEGWKRTATEYASELHSLRSRLAEARKALEPFAWIGQWLFARDLPDETPVVMVEGAGKPFALTRGMFKAAHTAARRALEAQGGE